MKKSINVENAFEGISIALSGLVAALHLKGVLSDNDLTAIVTGAYNSSSDKEQARSIFETMFPQVKF